MNISRIDPRLVGTIKANLSPSTELLSIIDDINAYPDLKIRTQMAEIGKAYQAPDANDVFDQLVYQGCLMGRQDIQFSILGDGESVDTSYEVRVVAGKCEHELRMSSQRLDDAVAIERLQNRLEFYKGIGARFRAIEPELVKMFKRGFKNLLEPTQQPVTNPAPSAPKAKKVRKP